MATPVLASQDFPVRRLILTCEVKDRKKAAQALGASAIKGGRFSYPPDEIVVQTLQHNFGGDIELTPEVQKWFDEQIAKRHHARDLQEAQPEHVNLPYDCKLKDYQRTMVNFGANVPRFINGDDRGLGKTLEAISVAEMSGASRVLVVCPGYLKLGWEREIEKWTSDTAIVTRGERAAREALIQKYFNSNSRYLIVNYEMIRPNKKAGGYPDLLLYPWDMVIFDEAHRLKGRSSQWTEGAKQFRKVPKVQFLTGNPISNSPDDIWQLLNLIDPLKFSSYWAFVEYYCNIVDTFFGKEVVGVNPHRMAQLQYALQPYLLRRLKQDVAPELPAKMHQRIEVELEGKQKTFYKRLEKQMVMELENGDLELVTALTAKQLRLQQAIANPAILGGADESIVEKTCIELLDDVLDGADKAIVATWFVPSADRLQAKLEQKWKVFRISAQLKDAQRDRVVEEFKTCKDKCVLVGTIRTMSEGLNIDECDHMILCDKSWTPLDNEQIEDRIHRVNSTRAKNYYHIVVRDTISADKEEVLENKIEARDEVLSMKKVAEMMRKRVRGEKP